MSFQCICKLGLEVHADEKSSSVRQQLEADDVMSASLFVQESSGGSAKEKRIEQVKVSIENAINTCIAKSKLAHQDISEKYHAAVALFDKYIAGKDESATVQIRTAKTLLDTAHVAVAPHFASVLEDLKSKAQDLQSSSDRTAICLIGDHVKEISKHLSTAPTMKRFNETCVAFKRNIVTAGRASVEELKSAGRAGQESTTVHPLVNAAKTVQQLLEQNIATSVYEAKAGIKGSMFVPTSGAMHAEIRKHPFVKKGLKDFSKHLQANDSGQKYMDNPTHVKKMFKILQSAMDVNFFTKLPIPQDSIAHKKMYEPEMFGNKESWFHIGFPAFGALEARYVIAGDLLVIGITVSMVPGETMARKRRHLVDIKSDALKPLVEEHGFIAMIPEQYGVVLPTGFMYILVAVTEVVGLRWNLSADSNDTLRTTTQLSQLLSEFPEMRAASLGYTALQEFLQREKS